jgi:hypothetical protein
VAALVTLIVDAKASGARLRDLQARQTAAVAAEAELSAARKAHDEAIAAERVDIDADKQRLAVERGCGPQGPPHT